jgi:exosortase A-associated hydrolase 2
VLIEPEAFFLQSGNGPSGQRFCIHHAPTAGPVRGLVVHVHALAEEMNKSRRMCAMQARALATAGFAVLQIDLLGCGDSAGDFGDATWHAWADDVHAGVHWLSERHAPLVLPLWLWGHRAGCLLAAEVAHGLGALGPAPTNLLFWHAATAGKALVQQLLRLRLASGLIDGKAKGAMEALRADLAAGRAVDIAGYRLNPALASGLEHAALTPPTRPGQLVWLELATSPEPVLSPAAAAATERWRAAAWAVQAQQITGPAFWQTTEIEDAPLLISATVAALNSATALPA